MLPCTVRPQPVSGRRPWWIGVLILAFGFPAMAYRWRAPQSVLVATGIICVALALAVVAIHWLYIHNRRLVVDDLSVSLFDLWGGQKTIPRAELYRIALRTVISTASNVPDERRLLLLDRDGRCSLAVPRYNLPYEQASGLAGVLRVPIDSPLERIVSRGGLRREIPGSLTWYEQNLVSVTIVCLVVILAVSFLFIWAIDGFT
jgi:hypothetical protein